MTALEALRSAEEQLNEVYAVAYRLYNLGMLTPAMRAGVHVLRDQTYTMERVSRAAIVRGIRVVSPAVSIFQLDRLIPSPVRRPSLPSANVGRPPTTPVAVPTTGMVVAAPGDIGTRLRSAAGLGQLGAVPLVVYAVVLIAVLAVIAAAAIVAAIGISNVTEMRTNSQRLEANTERYLEQSRLTERRYADCLARGGSLQECASLFPVPDAPQEPAPSDSNTLLWIGGAALLGVGAYYFWKRGQ